MTSYECTCGQKYSSPLKLKTPPVCSGGSRKHTPRNMKPIKEKS